MVREQLMAVERPFSLRMLRHTSCLSTLTWVAALLTHDAAPPPIPELEPEGEAA